MPFKELSKIVIIDKHIHEKYVAHTSVQTHLFNSIQHDEMRINGLRPRDKFAAEKEVVDFDWVMHAGNKKTNDHISASTKFGDGMKVKLNGDDQFHLGKGRDKFNSGGGDDSLFGEQHRDRLNGGKGSDLVDGGSGNDRVAGGRGTDTLIGGTGRDTFVFQKGDDLDTITDFNPPMDTIEFDRALRPGHMKAERFVTKFGEQDGDDFVMDFGNGDVLTIENAVKEDIVQGLEFG